MDLYCGGFMIKIFLLLFFLMLGDNLGAMISPNNKLKLANEMNYLRFALQKRIS